MTPKALVYGLAGVGFAAMTTLAGWVTGLGQPPRHSAPVADWPRKNPDGTITRPVVGRAITQRRGRYPTEPLPIPDQARSGEVAALRQHFQPVTTIAPPRRTTTTRARSGPVRRR
ncbi:hypothetical protein NDR87_14075 [Nocardia sp. CDC159]|uniref:Uncharacterized protein n=1 Tax=Nocardia pulmonis TaxID=2951408 RepID=A0A9X2E573_9NOCA|nr:MULTISPECIES: hypothetical protein [Nocardia]MCM6774449.1 hypothetical protein [Nocardia pulmonis]MCM6787485.1 hypothetical protein [Nocardia sp. CDC159]